MVRGRGRGISLVANTAEVYASLTHCENTRHPKSLLVCVPSFFGDLDKKLVHDSWYFVKMLCMLAFSLTRRT